MGLSGWLVDEAEVDPSPFQPAFVQLICHGLAQGKMKSLWLKVKKLSKCVTCARSDLFASYLFLAFPLHCPALRGTDP